MFYILLFTLPILSYSLQPVLSTQLMVAKTNLAKSVFDYSNHPSDIIQGFYGTTIGKDWTYSELLNNVDNNKVGAVSFLSDGKHAIAIDNLLNDDKIQSTNLHSVQILPNTYNTLVETISGKHINVDLIQLPENPFSGIFSAIGSTALQVGMFFFLYFIIAGIIRGVFFGQDGNNPMGNMLSQTMNMKDSGMLVDTNNLNVTFADVAGCDEAKYELMEVVDFLKNSTRFEEAGAKIPKGVLLEGNPGTGKTLLARAVASEAGVPFISASGSEFIEMFVGVGASRVRTLFDKARENSPCVVFIDEIDAVGRQRGAGIAGGNDEREQTLNQILTNMDGFQQGESIVVIAATNRIDILDKALTRPGRFDRKVNVPLPDYDGRIKIADVHFKNKKVDESVEFEELASLTPGFSGADIANLANEAAIISIRKNETTINRETLIDAFEKITIGLKSYNQDYDEEIIELVSYHETGHALMTALFPDFFDIRKVTINANKNGAGGFTLFTPKEKYQKYATKKFMLANLIIALGGRAAEVYLNRKKYKSDSFDNHVFNGFTDLDITTGASNDLLQANKIARDYITKYGFGEDFGMYDESVSNELPFVGKDLGTESKKISDSTKFNVDNQVKNLVDFAYKRAFELIEFYSEPFDKIIAKLSLDRTIDGNDIKEILRNCTVVEKTFSETI
mgnify:FL=1